MNIQDYLAKHEMTAWRTWPVVTSNVSQSPMPSFFVSADIGSKEFDTDDQFEIYANPDHTRFVSLNTTRSLFRIIHYDLIHFQSKWEPMRDGLNYRPLDRL